MEKLIEAVEIPLAPLKVPLPKLMGFEPGAVLVAKKVTVPVGVSAVPEPKSVTVAVKVTGVPKVVTLDEALRVMSLERVGRAFTVWTMGDDDF
jgi:hypothetical protein